MHPPEHTPEDLRKLNVCAGGARHTRVSFAHGVQHPQNAERPRRERSAPPGSHLPCATSFAIKTVSLERKATDATTRGPFFSQSIPVIKLNRRCPARLARLFADQLRSRTRGPSALRRVGNPWFPLPRRRTERPPPARLAEGVITMACFSLCNSKSFDMPGVLRETNFHPTRCRV